MKKLLLGLLVLSVPIFLHAETETLVRAGGVGGNVKIGERLYDDGFGNADSIKVTKINDRCYLKNNTYKIIDARKDKQIVNAKCTLNRAHNGVYWLSQDENNKRWHDDEAFGSYSPSIEAMYAAEKVQAMFMDWYHIPVVENPDHTNKPITIVVNAFNLANAYFTSELDFLYIGTGGEQYYNMVASDIIAHEFGHAFTMQHANFGGKEHQTNEAMVLHENFADMTAAALEYYLSGKNTWMIGYSVKKDKSAMRYMDEPTKEAGTVDHMQDYERGYIGGIVNKAFYLLATTKAWNTRKAFDVMVKANREYWHEETSSFHAAGCGALQAAAALKYPTNDVIAAFYKVGLDLRTC